MRTATALAIALSALGLCLPASGDDPKKPASEEAAAALIAQLGGPDFDKREEAARKLAEMPAALGPLRRAAETEKNPEVARRVREILPVLTKRVGAEKLKRLPGYAKERQLDRMVEAMVAWREAVSVEDRKVPRALAADILAWANKEFGPKLPELSVSGTPPEEYTAGGRRWRSRGDWITDTVEPDDKGRGVRVRGDGWIVCESDGLTTPVVYTNGDFTYTGLTKFVGGVIVGNGDMLFDRVFVEGTVVVCTGTVEFKTLVSNSLVVAGGGDIVMADDVKQDSLKRGTILRPHEKRVAEFFRLYDAAAEGLHVRIQDKNVFVERVDPDKPFAKAGVQAGDRIIRVNDVVVRDVRGLNRLLCRAEVGHPGTAVLSLARGEKGVEAVVKLAK